MNAFKKLCTDEARTPVVLQGNIAFAAGCVRSGIHAVDGYPGTPSTEVIDKGLSKVQDMIKVGWSVNEAVAASVGHGHSLAGEDCVVTMKIPGLFQAGDPISSAAFFTGERGALIYYVASDFTPSSTQHLVDPRPFLKSCFIPVFEPRNHQEMHEAAEIAADISRRYNTACVILAGGTLCHSEGLVRLSDIKKRDRVEVKTELKAFNTLPNLARGNYDRVVTERLPALEQMVAQSPLNRWEKGSGKVGVITCGVNELMVKEVKQAKKLDIDILSLGFTYPLPMELIHEFYASIDEEVFVVEDGYRCLQEALLQEGISVRGKAPCDPITEWTPALVAELLGYSPEIPADNAAKAANAATQTTAAASPLGRPPMICAGCPYRLFGETVRGMRKTGKIEAVFGDIGCNTLLYFMDALDTNVAMGASEANRMGYVAATPDKASKVISLLGDGTECHSGMDATRNTIFRRVPGVKVILDNYWTAMTGGQPSATSPTNLAGDENRFDLQAALKAHGAKVMTVSGYDRKGLQKALKKALALADSGEFITLVVTGTCIRKVPKSEWGTKMAVDPDKCRRCGLCQICPGISADKEGLSFFTNLCSGCVGQDTACGQMCPVGAIFPATPAKTVTAARAEQPKAPVKINLPAPSSFNRPEKLAVAIRGVGGQGNLFFGKTLTQFAFLAGYGETNVIKGETHGMAQMGGPVISTFSCGRVVSPVLLPGTADCLVAMEMSEVLRPGFVEMLRPGGTVLLADTRILPYGMKGNAYPAREAIKAGLKDYKVLILDVLKTAMALGDASGQTANVVMMGALSRLAPFDGFPEAIWLQALSDVSPTPAIRGANHAAFKAGQELF